MDKQTFLALILSSFLGLCSGFLGLGGSESSAKVQFHKGSQFGFEKDPNVYAHFVIPPWNRPFKPGYCLSWEWHTDKKYRDKRVAICKQYNEGTFCLFILLLGIIAGKLQANTNLLKSECKFFNTELIP